MSALRNSTEVRFEDSGPRTARRATALRLALFGAVSIGLSVVIAADEQVEHAPAQAADVQSRQDALTPGSAAARELLESRVEGRVLQDLRASADGMAYIIVMLRPLAARGPMDEGQRMAAIKAKQDAVINKLTAVEFAPRYQYKTFPGFTGFVNQTGLEKLAVDPDVLSIGADAEVTAVLAQSVPHINADQVHALGITGAGVTVAVLDTGIDKVHPDISDNVAAGDFTFLNNGATQVPGGQDDNGHGTNVAGIITSRGVVAPIGVAPDADILSIKVLDAAGNGFVTDWVAGVDYVVANRANYNDLCAINMSLSTNQLFSTCPCDNNTTFNQAAQASILAAKNAGIATFAASGNNGICGQMGSPACLSAAVAVAATYDPGDIQPDDQITTFSNRNACIDLSAPGNSITAPGLGGGTSTFQGTSQATPHVAGVAALMCQKCPGFDSPDSIVAIMKSTGVATTDPPCGILPHPPRVDALAAVNRMNELCIEHVKFSQPPYCECKADIDKDGAVTLFDLTTIVACAGGDCSGCFDNSCDVDCDGDVDADDINAADCLFNNNPPATCCPPFEGEDIESNIDWVDMQPNVVVADDFTSDGRPITGVRWWGSVLKEPCTKLAPAGDDCWSTACDGTTSVEFGGAGTIPAIGPDFFGGGSDPFSGVVPVGGSTGFADTIVRRHQDMCLDGPLPLTETVDIELVSLSLVSCSPITVTFNGGQNPTLFDMRVLLDGPQPLGFMDVTKSQAEGGTFNSVLPVVAYFRFLDFFTGQPFEYHPGVVQNMTTTDAPWMQDPPAIGPVCGAGGFFPGYDKNDTTCCPNTCHRGPSPDHPHCVTPPKCPKCPGGDPKVCNNPGLCQLCDSNTNPNCSCASRATGEGNCFDLATLVNIPCFSDFECPAGTKCFNDPCWGLFCAANCPGLPPADGRTALEPLDAASVQDGIAVAATEASGPPKCAPIGQDGFTTLCDPQYPTRYDFSQTPIPPDFFYNGSPQFTGVVDFGGPGGFPADTIVQRLADMCFPDPLPVQQTIPIQIVQLNLVSCSPIDVGGQFFDVHVTLSGPQAQGTLTATKSTPTGGTYTASLPVNAEFLFEPAGGGPFLGPIQAAPITLNTDPPGFWLQTCCDTGTGSTGFFPGWKDDKPGLTQPCCKPTCHPNPAGGHAHCVWPPDCQRCPDKPPPPPPPGDLNWDGWFISFHVPVGDPFKAVDAYVIDDRFAEQSIGLTNGGDLIWLNQFNVLADFETINAITVGWGDVADGTETTVLLYDDPNNDGDPADAVLLAFATTSAVAESEETVDIPDTVAGAAGDSFFLAAFLTHGAGRFPAAIDQTAPQGRSWVTGGAAGSLDLNNMALNPAPAPMSVVGNPPGSLDGNWILRASAVAVPPDQDEPLALYYCDEEFVDILPTPLPACDGHPVEEYRVDLEDCCLVHANVDPRSGLLPAQKDAFFEEKCFEYMIDIQAVVGHEYIQDPATLECIEQPTGLTLDGPFWGWHTSPDEHFDPAVQTSVKMGPPPGVCIGGPDAGLPCSVATDCTTGTCSLAWLYGPWSPVVPVCSLPNMAFELLTRAPSDAQDCNHNWVPDQCEPDCQPNGIPDDCDINGGGSTDNNGNGIPDECECCTSSSARDVQIPDTVPGNPLKRLTTNRALIIQAGGDAGCSGQAIRVVFEDLPPPYDLWNGERLWVGPPFEVSEVASLSDSTAPTRTWARLQCAPECRNDWDTLGDIHVIHEGVIPNGVYDIQVVDCTAPQCLGDEALFSPILSITNAAYGDTIRDCAKFPCGPPNGPPIDVADAIAVLAKFSNAPGAIRKARADLEPAILDRVINVGDALEALRGFAGLPYRFVPSTGDPCP